MNTPICDFVKSYCDQSPVRLHMPAHKGQPFLGFEQGDITEVDGADVLYHPTGIIAESQQNAAELFGSAKTVYSTEGSSLAIRGMVALVRQYAAEQGTQPLILAGRNAHKTFVTAAALLDVSVDWLFGEENESLVSCSVSPERLARRLEKMPQKPTAVYITSPDYLGNQADVEGFAKVCEQYGVLLLVDNAHGAYLKFLNPSRHPLDLGAHLCCDSAHKTLPVVTGGAYLHIAQRAPSFFKEQVTWAMDLFASTSPSYLILQSLDGVNPYLAEEFPGILEEYLPKVAALKTALQQAGYILAGEEPLKVTIAPKSYGYTGEELATYLRKNGLICEFYDPDFVVLMLAPVGGDQVLEVVRKVLTALPQKEGIATRPPAFLPPESVLPLQAALFARTEELPLAQCEGRILSAPTVSCPPAVPVAVCGEKLNPSVLELMKYYGHTTCLVVKQQD